MDTPSANGRRHDPQEPCEVLRARSGTTVRVTVRGELDLATVPRLRSEIDGIDSAKTEIVVLEFQHVTFMDSTGLHALLDAHDRLDGRIRIIASPPIDRLLDITGVRDRLPLIEADTVAPWPIGRPGSSE